MRTQARGVAVRSTIRARLEKRSGPGVGILAALVRAVQAMTSSVDGLRAARSKGNLELLLEINEEAVYYFTYADAA